MTRTTFIYSILLLAAASALTIAAVTLAPAITSAGGGQGSEVLEPSDFSTYVDNPLFPLSTLGPKVFEGQETDPDTGETVATRLESTVLDKTRKVAGVEVLVLEEIAYEDGEVIEVALDYFAQHENGDVYYFGEKVDNYVDGKIDNHDGAWLAGKKGAQAGIVMPAHPFVGQLIKNELAPGIAEDEALFLALNESVSTPAGDFTGCAKTEDSSPLDPSIFDFKFYCPGVGLAREDSVNGSIFLTSYSSTNAVSVDAEADAVGPSALALAETPTPSADLTAAVVEDDAQDEDADAEEDVGEADDDDDGAPGQLVEGSALLPQASITLEQAIAAALAAAQGELGEVELEEDDGKLIFIVEIGDEDIEVDAQTGEVLADDEDDEDKDETETEDEGVVQAAMNTLEAAVVLDFPEVL